MKIEHNLILATASIAVSCVAVPHLAEAATITYDFRLNATSGNTANNPFSTGSFSFEAPNIPNFNGTIPTSTFQISNPGEFRFNPASVLILSGKFQGLFALGSQRVEEETKLTFDRGNGIICNYRRYSYANIRYDINLNTFFQVASGRGGYETTPSDLCGGNFNLNFNDVLVRGDVIYSLRSVPESSSVWGISILGLAYLLRHQQKRTLKFRVRG